jgi:hypothetical protein
MITVFGALLGFAAASILGAMFCNVLLTMYEHAKADLGNPDAAQTRRLIFRWSLGAGMAFGLIYMVTRHLLSN